VRGEIGRNFVRLRRRRNSCARMKAAAIAGMDRDAHRHTSRFSSLLLGGQDGLVNVLGVILGVAAASNDAHLVLVAGLAAAIAESISMAAVAYTATGADRALYQAEQARELRHIAEAPELERDEIRQIYRDKGFDGALLEDIVRTVTANPEVWVAVMMAEELKLSPVDDQAPRREAVIVGLSALFGSLVPVAPYLLLPLRAATIAGLLFSALTLFAAGAWQARLTVGHWARRGLELLLIGLGSAAAGWVVGRALRLPPG
jgi:vacuolar iron transporter family protein